MRVILLLPLVFAPILHYSGAQEPPEMMEQAAEQQQPAVHQEHHFLNFRVPEEVQQIPGKCNFYGAISCTQTTIYTFN